MDKFKLLEALGICHQFEKKIRKYIRENRKGIFQRISFADSTKFVVQYKSIETGEYVDMTLEYEDFGYE